MRIAILSSASAGGAGIAAYRIFEALSTKQGNEVDFFNIDVLGAVDQNVSPQISASNKKITNTHFTIDYASERRQWLIDLLADYDIVNIQWSSYLISLSEILELAELGKQIIFTLHDFYYITGGCHYPAGCYGYLNDCIACPQLDENVCGQLIVKDALKFKRKLFSYTNVHLAAPSAFIVESAIRSGLIPESRGHVLRNAYSPLLDEKQVMSAEAHSLLLIADSFDEERKGLELAVAAVREAAKALLGDAKEIQLHLVGGLDIEVVRRLIGTGVKVIPHGHIKQHDKLVEIFHQCQFVLSCSYEDNWPNILVESASYGCIPIVGRWHGCEEFVSVFSAGFLAENYSVTSFSKVIVEAFALPCNERESISKRLIKDVRLMHSYAHVAQTYEVVFNMMVDSFEHEAESAIKPKNILFSRNHLITNIKLEYGRAKLAGTDFYCQIKTKASPFGYQGMNDPDSVVINSLNENCKEHDITSMLLKELLLDGYGLKSYCVQIES